MISRKDSGRISQTDDDERQISDCEKQLRQYVELRQNHYEQFVTGEIDRDTYLEIKNDCGANIEKLNNKLTMLAQEKRDKLTDQKLITVAKDALSVTASARANVDALIEKIFVYPGNHIEIQWRVPNFA